MKEQPAGAERLVRLTLFDKLDLLLEYLGMPAPQRITSVKYPDPNHKRHCVTNCVYLPEQTPEWADHDTVSHWVKGYDTNYGALAFNNPSTVWVVVEDLEGRFLDFYSIRVQDLGRTYDTSRGKIEGFLAVHTPNNKKDSS